MMYCYPLILAMELPFLEADYVIRQCSICVILKIEKIVVLNIVNNMGGKKTKTILSHPPIIVITHFLATTHMKPCNKAYLSAFF